MKRKILVVVACAAFAFVVFAFGSNEAAAQCGYGGYGGHGNGYGSSFGYSGYARSTNIALHWNRILQQVSEP